MAGEVRQRRNKKKHSQATKEEEKPPAPAAPLQEQTLWQTFRSHPLVKVMPYILIPYAFYLAFNYFRLQRPDLVASATLGMIQLRPAVSVTDERQLLIVGTMNSGMEEVVVDLNKKLKLEVGHVSSDTKWKYVRDGTVSWFHGIRFLEPIELKDLVLRWSRLCGNYTADMLFHRDMYDSSACPSYKLWSKCWAKQCFEILRTEWGCAANCQTPYRTALLQVRHPLRNMESLVTQFCEGGLNGTIHPTFVAYASALFPSHDYGNDSCIEATAHYVLDYNQAMLKARSKGLIADVFRIEETSPCEVATLVGLMEPATTVYAPNSPRIAAICEDPICPENQVMQVHKVPQNKRNTELLSLKWEDLHGGLHGSRRSEGDTTVERQIRELTKTLGYNPDQE
jgi:hypothetical protein